MSGNEKDFDPAVASLPSFAAVDENGVTIAMIRINMNPADPDIIGIHWLPDFFSVPLDAVLKRLLVRHLRVHADKLESGELEEKMQKYHGINTPSSQA